MQPLLTEKPLPPGISLPTGTVTFLFTDIQGSTPLWESKPEEMAQALQVHHAALRQAISAHGGVVFKTIGDAFQVSFPTALQALKAAIEAQRLLHSAPWNSLGELKVRMGIHTGEAELDPGGDEYAVSHTKNRTARIMSAAHGGQILLSAEASELCNHQLPGEVSLKNMGEHRLKGMSTPEHLFQVLAPGLVQEFPPLSSATEHLHNLPIQLTSFIGREQEIATVVDLLAKHRLVTLTGSGGTGKTRLSLHVARQVLEQFPNGVWLVELAGLGDPDLVPRSTLAALGLQESATKSLLAQLEDYLKEKHLLLVLDNCEHVIEDCARMAEVLVRACPGLKILASSREALGVAGEAAYRVPSLSTPDPRHLPPIEELNNFTAVQLFAERAASAQPGFTITPANAASVAQICRRLDGIPLAIELAAARVSVLGVESIAARLDSRFRLLIGGSRTALPRQQTLRASIDWSFSLLDERERLLLLRLSVFFGGWTLEAASAVCGFGGLDEFEVIDGLAQLANKSLIVVESEADAQNRYRMLETIRQYAREKLLDSDGSGVIRDRHLEAFATLVETAEPHLRSHHQVEWLDRLEVELDNLRAALEWALEGEARKGLRLTTSLYWFWHIRGYRVEGEAWLRQMQGGIDAEQASADDLELLGTARARQAMLLCAIGRLGPQATRTAEEALAMAEKLGPAGKRIQNLGVHALAWNAGYLGQKSILDRLFHQCLVIAQEIGDPFLIAEALQNLSFSEPDRDKAMKYCESNLALRRELGDLDGMMTAQSIMGSFYFGLGDFTQACCFLEESIQTAHTVKNRMGLISAHCSLGRVYYDHGMPDNAIDHFLQALGVAQDLGEQAWVIWQYNALGNTYGLKKDWQKTQYYFQQVIELSRADQITSFEVISHIHLAECAWIFGDIETAIQNYQTGVEIGQGLEELHLEGLVAYGTGKKALLNGDLRLAEEFFRIALKLFGESNLLNHLGPSLGALAVCAIRAGQLDRAIRLHGIVASRRWLNDPLLLPWLISYDLDTLLAPARTSLGEMRWEQLYQEGHAMTLEQAVGHALEELPPGASHVSKTIQISPSKP